MVWFNLMISTVLLLGGIHIGQEIEKKNTKYYFEQYLNAIDRNISLTEYFKDSTNERGE